MAMTAGVSAVSRGECMIPARMYRDRTSPSDGTTGIIRQCVISDSD